MKINNSINNLSSNSNQHANLKATLTSKALVTIYSHLLFFLSGVFVSSGAVFGQYAPFGASLVASVPFKNLLSSLLGVCVGYLAFSDGSGFRYVATIIAIGAIRWTLSDIKKINKAKLFPPIIAFVPMLATGLVLASVVNFAIDIVSMTVIEALLSAVGAYFFTRCIALSYSTKTLSSFNQQEVACLAMTGCILLLSLSNIAVSGISLGRIIAVIVILFCSQYGAVAGGCISGVTTGVLFSMTSNNTIFLAGSYAFGGLMAGLFSSAGKLGVIFSFLTCSVIMSFQSMNTATIIATLYEVVIASLIFFFIPKSLGNQVTDIFAPPIDKMKSEGLRKNIIMRLDFASKALEDVSSCVDNVAEKMKDVFSNDITEVYNNSARETCSSCGLRVYCLQKHRHTSQKDLGKLTEILQKKGEITEEEFATAFTKKCCKVSEMTSSINKNYNLYVAGISAEMRVGEIRSVVAGQFSGLGNILGEMASEFEHFEKFDTVVAQRISSTLKMLGIVPIDVSCRIDKLNRMTVEIESFEVKQDKIKNNIFIKEISKASGRRLDTPVLSVASNRSRITMTERPLFDTQIGSAQHISGEGKLCGDSYNYFNDGMGRMVAIISDGMGTGGRAAVDGSMAENIMTKLIKAGLGYDCALRVVNSALMVKSGDESLATLDIASIDLFTGKIELLKAGAPLSIIRKKGQTYRSNSASLPAGILADVKFSHDSVSLGINDWLILVSDGAIATGDMWLEKLIEEKEKLTAPEMAKEILKEAKQRRTDGRDDDITAIAIKMCYDSRQVKLNA